MSIVEELGRFVAEVELAELPAEVVHAGRRALLDTLGVAIAGSADPAAVAARRAYRDCVGLGRSLVLGGGETAAEFAALCNGVAAHSPEMDDFHRAATVHPGAVVVPAALAAGQEAGVNGARLLESVVAGYEVAIRVGLATRGSLYGSGFHPTAVLGVFGAAAAAGRAMGLQPSHISQALGLAGTRGAGLLAYKVKGDWSKRLQVGTAASLGVGAARLAAAGFRGPTEVVEGQYGLLGAYARGAQCPRDALLGLRERYHVGEVSFKPYASCRFTHAPVDALLAAMRRGQVRPEEVLRIEVAVHSQAMASVMVPADRKYRPETPVDAQFSLPYCLAVAARLGHVPPDAFTVEAISDPVTLGVASRVVAAEDPAYTALFPGRNAARVTVHTNRGVFESEVMDARGDPERPLSDADLETKFVVLARGAMGGEIAARGFARAIWQLDEAATLQSVVALLPRSDRW